MSLGGKNSYNPYFMDEELRLGKKAHASMGAMCLGSLKTTLTLLDKIV